jgi:hypothetical protein
MAFTAHTLVAFGGKLTNNTSPDQWQCGVRLAILDPDGISWRAGLSDPQVYLNALHAPLLTWFQRALVTTAGSEFATLRADAYLDWVKVNNIDALGHYADPTTTHRFDYSGTAGGGGSVNIIPPFVTAAVSLTTALARGRGHRGRIYLPFSIPLSTTERVNATTLRPHKGRCRHRPTDHRVKDQRCQGAHHRGGVRFRVRRSAPA